MLIDLDSITKHEDTTVFGFNQSPNRSYEKDYNAIVDVTYEMDLDKTILKRHGYYLFDFISDIGGIQGFLYSTLAFLLSIWNYKMFDNHMVSRLYKLEKSDSGTRQIKDAFEQSDFMKTARFQDPKEYFRDSCPSWLCFCKSCKPDRQELGFIKGRERLQRETNIIEIIKSRRYFNATLRFLLTKNQRMRLKKRGRYTAINPDVSEDDKAKENSDELTDGFYSSESDAYVPDDAGGGTESDLIRDNTTALNIGQSLYSHESNA